MQKAGIEGCFGWSGTGLLLRGWTTRTLWLLLLHVLPGAALADAGC